MELWAIMQVRLIFLLISGKSISGKVVPLNLAYY
jgi:hypothetical protein